MPVKLCMATSRTVLAVRPVHQDTRQAKPAIHNDADMYMAGGRGGGLALASVWSPPRDFGPGNEGKARGGGQSWGGQVCVLRVLAGHVQKAERQL